IRDSNSITGPDIRFYNHNDVAIPNYTNSIPLELRPLGASSVQYFPCIAPLFVCPSGDWVPVIPSLISGSATQSVYFVSSVSLGDEGNSAIDKDGFMLDSGAQITVVGSAVGALLGFNPANPDFEVEIVGVTGTVTIKPGFYIDSLTIPALGEWLSFSNVPVILLDVASPEGGFLEGIIGMNLFTELNLVLRGGGMPGQGAPSLKFALIPRIIGDIAPPGGDGKVDMLDLIALALAWSSHPASANWNPDADIAPVGSPDGLVNNLDFTILSEHWQEGVGL
ncbi:MAG: aspartyl protease family protein, partial [Planctomycetes bacterium]|nr:aspartyl protease family protein [Planctomycetota bacterium]